MKKIIIIIIVVGAVIFAAAFLRDSGPPSTEVGVDIDTNKQDFSKAPEFTLKDNAGNDVSLSDFEGKIRIINSWAVWCPFCKKELEDFAALQQEFKDDIVVIAIDRAESLELTKEFTDSIEVTDELIFLLDPSDSFYKSIGAFAMPETIFVDREGNITIHKRGPMELDEMREKVHELLRQTKAQN